MNNNPWKNVLIDKLIISHILKAEHETNPELALNDLLAYESQLTLDPKVSLSVAQLIATAKAEEIRWAANQALSYGVQYEYARIASQQIASKIKNGRIE